MKLRNLLLAASLLLPLVAGARPAIIVKSPKLRAELTNAVLTATGTAKGAPPIAAVYYSLNGSDWAPAIGTTNWSVPSLALTAGANTLRVYAQDTNAAVSLTNEVTFTYVVKLPLPVTVSPEGGGHVSPGYNGKLLQIGNKYVMNAVAGKGFRFEGWSLNGTALTNPAHLPFVMASNLSYTARFVDEARPLCVITSPAVQHSVSNSPLVATVRARDNAGVTAVYYQLNGGGWQCQTTSLDGTTWSLPELWLSAGVNTLQAYAADAAGNRSLTNTVTFNYVSGGSPIVPLGPASLAGLVGTVTGATGSNGVKQPFELSFDMSTFAQCSKVDPHDSKVGNYTYTILSSNTVQLAMTTVSPPTKVDGVAETHILVFTNSTTCLFTNDSDGTLGCVTFGPAFTINPPPSPSLFLRVQYWETNNNVTGTLLLNEGVFTNYTDYESPTQTAANWGTYTLEQFSPVVAMLQLNYTDPTAAGQTGYTVMRFPPDQFLTSQSGWSTIVLDGMGNEVYDGVGSFGSSVTSAPPPGSAPASLAGTTVTVSPDVGTSFTVCFGDCTYSVFDQNLTNQNSAVGDYTYMKTGSVLGSLTLTTVAPWFDSATNVQVVSLDFLTATNGIAVSPQGVTHFKVAAAKNYAPTSLAGRKLTSQQGSLTFNQDGTCSLTSHSGGQQSGTYTYAQYSPDGGLVTITYPSGDMTYFQLQFTSSSATLPSKNNNWFETDVAPDGTFTGSNTGTFTLQ